MVFLQERRSRVREVGVVVFVRRASCATFWWRPGFVLACACVLACAGCSSEREALPAPAPISTATVAPPFSNPIYQPPAITAGDWPEFRHDDQRTGNNPLQQAITRANVASLAPKWIFATGGVFASAVVVEGNVYVADLGGRIFSLNESNGGLQWTYALGASNAFIATPAFANGMLYDGTVSGRFYAVNAATGQQLWEYPVTNPNGSFQGSPLVAEGAVFEGQTDFIENAAHCIRRDQLLAYNPSSAGVLSTLTLTPRGSSGASVWSSPVLDLGGYMYLATGNSCSSVSSPYADSIVRVDPAEMEVMWSTHGPPDAHDLDFGATPVFVNSMIVDGAKDGNVYAMDAASGRLLWKTAAGVSDGVIIGSLATDGTHIFVPYVDGATGGAVVALGLDGSVAWTLDTANDYNGFGVLSAPAVSQGLVFVAYKQADCSNGMCFGISALDANTGQVLWRYATQHAIYAGPTVVTGGVLVGEFDGTSFYCFTPNGQ